MDELLRQRVVDASRALAAAGLADLVWGHASIRDPAGRGVWLKTFGGGLDEVDHGSVVLVSLAGDVLIGSGEPPVEIAIHTELMKARSDIAAVVHTHSAAVVAFASLEEPLRPISHDGVLFAYPDIPRFEQSGGLIRTEEVGRDLAATIGQSPACLMPRHGMVSVGGDPESAVMTAVLLNRACDAQLIAMAAGGPMSWSNEQETREKRSALCTPRQFAAAFSYLVRRSPTSNGSTANHSKE